MNNHYKILINLSVAYFKQQKLKMAQAGVDLKSEDDVKEYLERLGIEYRFGCYYEKNGKGKDYFFLNNRLFPF